MIAWLWFIFIVVPLFMFLLYTVGIQYQGGGVCLALVFVVLAAWLLDVLLNYTVLVIYTRLDWPRGREYTFSQRMPRLIAGGPARRRPGPVGRQCLLLAHALNALAPKTHINLER
jgi:hypothetical protein